MCSSDDSNQGPEGASEPALQPATRQLVEAARAGDTDSFSSLYARVAPGLQAWAAIKIRPRFRAYFEPQDIVQEVWFRAWKRLDTLKEPRAFRGWVFQIAKHVLLEGFRRVRDEDSSKISGSPSSRLFALRELPESATAVSARVGRDESLMRFVEFAESLPEEERLLLVFLGLEGMSLEETAARLDLKKATVTKRWQRLRARLREGGTPPALREWLEAEGS